MAYPEKHLHAKAPKRPRHAEGMKQVKKTKKQPKMSNPKSGHRVDHAGAMIKALMGVANRKHAHDGSK